MQYQNQYVYIDCDTNTNEISFRDKTDHANWISGYTTKKRGVKHFITFLGQVFQDERLKDDITFKDLQKMLDTANVQYRTYCAMD